MHLLIVLIALDFIKTSLLGDLSSLASLGRRSRPALGSSLLRILILVIILGAVTVFLLIVLELRGLDLVVVGFFDAFFVVDFFWLRGLALLGFWLCWGVSRVRDEEGRGRG